MLRRIIGQAEQESLAHINRVLSPLNLSLSSDHWVMFFLFSFSLFFLTCIQVTSQLRVNKEILLKRFNKLLESRERSFPIAFDGSMHNGNIALQRHDLELVLKKYKLNIFIAFLTCHRSALILSRFYPVRMLAFKTDEELVSTFAFWNFFFRNCILTISGPILA